MHFILAEGSAVESIGESFRRHRLLRGLSQREVAASARVSRTTMSDFENGGMRISVANLQRLLHPLGLTLAFREASSRPTLDEVADLYRAAEPEPLRKRAPRTKSR
jgi:transcriptional regulator with XRE-family HTH domain